MLAWHFTTGNMLKNRQSVPKIGETLVHAGEVRMCKSVLHSSNSLIDALQYAPGTILHRVDCEDIVEKDENKLVCRKRTILWSLNIEDILKKFARKCALDVIHLWNAPQVVIKYLKTGNEDIKAKAYEAAADAVCVTAHAAAAIAYAADASARAADATFYTTACTAYAAARAAAIAYAADTASYTAACAAAIFTRKKQNKRLTQMVMTKYNRSSNNREVA